MFNKRNVRGNVLVRLKQIGQFGKFYILSMWLRTH